MENLKKDLIKLYRKFPSFKKVIDKQDDEYLKFLYLHLTEGIKIKILEKEYLSDEIEYKEINFGKQYCKTLLLIYKKFLNEKEIKILEKNDKFYVTYYLEEYPEKGSEEYFVFKNRRDFLIPCFFHKKTIEFLQNMNYKENMNYNERFERFHKLLGKLRKFVKTKERLGTMIDSSFSLKAYNVRRNKDIDLVCLHPKYYEKKVKLNLKYGLKKELKYVDVYIPNIQIDWVQKTKKLMDENTRLFTNNKLTNFNEVVFHPDYHFYFFGIKVISLHYDLQYRAKRRYPKNVADLIIAKKKLSIKVPKIKPLENEIQIYSNIYKKEVINYTKEEFINKVNKYLIKWNFSVISLKKEIEEISLK